MPSSPTPPSLLLLRQRHLTVRTPRASPILPGIRQEYSDAYIRQVERLCQCCTQEAEASATRGPGQFLFDLWEVIEPDVKIVCQIAAGNLLLLVGFKNEASKKGPRCAYCHP